MLLSLYIYTVFIYINQLIGAINHARLYKQKFVFSTIAIIIARLLGRALGIYVFAKIFMLIPNTNTWWDILIISLIIICSTITSIFGELLVRMIVSLYVKHHASKVISKNKDEYNN